MATGLVRWNPWNDLFSLQNHFDQLLSSAFGDSARDVSNLAIDIRQTDDAYIIDASIPGFKPENIEVTLDNSLLTIRGKLDERSEAKEGGYLHRERRLSSVYRQVSLPSEVRAEEISADFNDGVLTVRVPRMAKAEPKRIEVKSADGTKQVVDAK